MKLCDMFHVSPRRSCGLIQLQRSTFYYKSRAKDVTALTLRLVELARTRVRYGVRRLYEILRREGWHVNHKRVHRLYVMMGLQLHIRRNIKRASHTRVPIEQPETRNEHWSMDFMADMLDNSHRFRMLTIVDNFTRECPALIADFSLNAQKVIACLEQLKYTRGLPKAITVDNGSEFISRAMDSWAYQNKVQLDFIRPGKPTENAFIESFNGKLRDECLNTNTFLSIDDARQKVEAWRRDYNTYRPHSAIGNLAPEEFVRRQKPGPKNPEILNLAAV